MEEMSAPATNEMSKAYDPREVEGRIYNFWLEEATSAPPPTPAGSPSWWSCRRPTSQANCTWDMR